MKKWPDIEEVKGLTLEAILASPLFATASDAEIAYSARCSVSEVRAAKRARGEMNRRPG